MTPGLTIKEGARIRIRQLRGDDIPRMAAGDFGGEEGAERWYAEAMINMPGEHGITLAQVSAHSADVSVGGPLSGLPAGQRHQWRHALVAMSAPEERGVALPPRPYPGVIS